MGCRDHPWEGVEGQVVAAATLKPILDAADRWRDELATRGTAVSGNVRFAVGIRDKALHSGPFVE